MADRDRLDQLLVTRGLVETRARARDAILRGHVRIAGVAVEKPGQKVAVDAELSIDDPAADYVSRSALKLKAGLERFAIDVRGKVALDLGASTGGFTDVLLRAGAARVYAVDVGHSQLPAAVAADPRVINLERTHARDLSLALVPEAIEILVADVSFISLKKALPPALELIAPLARLAVLVKPQFEVGKPNIGKGGIVRQDNAATRAVAEDIAHWLAARGWVTDGIVESPVKGGDGNTEYLLGATRQQ